MDTYIRATDTVFHSLPPPTLHPLLVVCTVASAARLALPAFVQAWPRLHRRRCRSGKAVCFHHGYNAGRRSCWHLDSSRSVLIEFCVDTSHDLHGSRFCLPLPLPPSHQTGKTTTRIGGVRSAMTIQTGSTLGQRLWAWRLASRETIDSDHAR